MKGVDIFCASQAATSICLSMEPNSTASPSTTTLLGGGGGGRVIDRHNPIIRDSKRTSAPKPTPSHPPTTTTTSKPRKLQPKKKKNSNENQPNKTDTSSLSKLDDDKTRTSAAAAAAGIARKSWSCTKPGDFLSPPGSTRYLLREKVYYNTLSDSDPTKLCVEESSNKEEPTPLSDPSQHEVVVLRVSLHCRGCEKKLRKHLSRMEGVKSFDIDFLAKKVTVTGNVTASDVVPSISKVMKNAQLWSSSIPSSNSNLTSEIKTHDNNIVSNPMLEIKTHDNNIASNPTSEIKTHDNNIAGAQI